MDRQKPSLTSADSLGLASSNKGRLRSLILKNLISLSALTSNSTLQVGTWTFHRGPPTIRSWNTVFCTRSRLSNLGRIREISADFFGSAKYRVTLLTGDDRTTQRRFRGAGFCQTRELDTMVLYPTSTYRPLCASRIATMVVKHDALEDWTKLFVRIFLQRIETEEDCDLFRQASRVDRTVGYVGESPVSIISSYSNGGVCQIGSVATVQEFRNRGLATLLLHSVLPLVCQHNSLVYLTVGSSNPSKSIYLHAGFRKVGIQRYFEPM